MLSGTVVGLSPVYAVVLLSGSALEVSPVYAIGTMLPIQAMQCYRACAVGTVSSVCATEILVVWFCVLRAACSLCLLL